VSGNFKKKILHRYKNNFKYVSTSEILVPSRTSVTDSPTYILDLIGTTPLLCVLFPLQSSSAFLHRRICHQKKETFSETKQELKIYPECFTSGTNSAHHCNIASALLNINIHWHGTYAYTQELSLSHVRNAVNDLVERII
jgi:hypothetical protein